MNMKSTYDFDKLVKDPRLLVDLCREVIDCQSYGNVESAAMEAQLKEIAKAVEKLEKIGVAVPDALRSEKTRLAAALSTHADVFQALSSLAEGLDEILKELNARLGTIKKQTTTRKSSPRRGKVIKTDRKILRSLIIQALMELGGSARKWDVLNLMETLYEGKFLPGDHEYLPDGKRLNWTNNTEWECTQMRKEGLLNHDSPRGIWELRRK